MAKPRVAKSAVKKARQFELQRHVRQLKQAQQGKNAKLASITDLEEELNILKQMDVDQAAKNALTTKLIKSKLLPKPQMAATMDPSQAEAFPLWPVAKEMGIDTKQNAEHDSERTDRVVHQVQSAKVLAEELTACIRTLSTLVAPQTPKETHAAREEKDADKPQPSAAKMPVSNDTKESPPTEAEEYSSDDGFSDEETDRVMSKTPNYEDLDKLDAMVASGSDSEEVSFDGSSKDDLDYDSETSSQPSRAKRQRSETPDDSEFLPSLASGFIPAAKGDDWSDGEADFADRDVSGKGPAKSMRKNRRGQRERRAYVFLLTFRIWEKKYGRHANHLKLREEESRQPKRRDMGHQRNKTLSNKPVKVPPASGSNELKRSPPQSSVPERKPEPKPEAPLMHPSWAAKQRAKMAEISAKPTGKKITFD